MKSWVILYYLKSDEEITKIAHAYEEFGQEARGGSMASSQALHVICKAYVVCALHCKSSQL